MTERTCSIEGCDRPRKGRGLCSMHYQRHKYRGDLIAVAPAVADRCKVCGNDLPQPHDFRKLFCSPQCKEADRRIRYRETRDATRARETCEHCGGSLAGMHADARFCSEKCGSDFHNAASAAARRVNRRPCVNCGIPIPLHARRFCSSGCAVAYRRPQTYGLAPAELAALLEQHGTCAICRLPTWGKRGPQVDHDHATGKVRGVLCINCNNGLGRFKDDPARLRAAAAYLEAHTAM